MWVVRKSENRKMRAYMSECLAINLTFDKVERYELKKKVLGQCEILEENNIINIYTNGIL